VGRHPSRSNGVAGGTEGAGRTRRPSLKGVSPLQERLLPQLAALGSPLAPLQAAWAPEARPQALALVAALALWLTRACRQPIGPTRSTVLASAWKRRLRQTQRPNRPLRLRDRAWSWAEPDGDIPVAGCWRPWACSRRKLAGRLVPGRSASGLSLRRDANAPPVVEKVWWAWDWAAIRMPFEPLLRASETADLPSRALWPPPEAENAELAPRPIPSICCCPGWGAQGRPCQAGGGLPGGAMSRI